MKNLILLSLLLFCLPTLNGQVIEPLNLISNVTVATDWSTVITIENSFNEARRQEEIQLGLCTNAIQNLDLPDQATWDAYTDNQRALIILNDGRTSRAGVDYGNGTVKGQPFNGIEENIDNVAQNWSQFLIDNQIFGHCFPVNGVQSCPAERIAAGYPAGCTEVGGGIENIWASSGSPTITSATLSAIFTWIYIDSGSQWGHRRAMLSQTYNDNYGDPLQEGFVGIGVAQTNATGSTFKTIVTINFTNPVSNAAAVNCGYNLSVPTNSVPGCLSSVTLTSPNGTETITAGTPYNVTWNTSTCFATTNVNILLSLDGGATFPVTLVANTPATDGNEMVTIPAGIPNNTTSARIRIESTGSVCPTTSFFDTSDANFTINSNCLLTASNICPADSVSFPSGNAGLNLTIVPDYFSGGITQWTPSSTTGSPESNMVNSSGGASMCNILTGWGIKKYQVLDFKVSQAGDYNFSIQGGGFNQMSVYTGNGFDPNNLCNNFYRAVSSGNGLAGNGNMNNVTLTPCNTYQLVFWFLSAPPQSATVNISSNAGVVYTTAGAPGTNYNYTYIAVNRANNLIVASSNTANFTGLSAGDYLIHGTAYYSGTGVNPPPSTPASWINNTMAQVLGTGTCINFSGNSKAVNISTGTGIELNVKALLQGPYNSSLMNDNLRAATPSLIPAIEPYTALPEFTHINGGGEMVASSVLAVTGNNAIVDWVFIELRSKTAAATILHTRSALIQRDGDIVDVDGISPLTFAVASPDDYYVAVRHRNHLGIRTNAVVALSGTAVTIDFTLSSTLTFGTNARQDLGGGVLGMWGGNADSNGSVRATGLAAINDYSNLLSQLGTPTNIQTNVYMSQDLNMDGMLRVSGSTTINDYSKLLNILGTVTNIINEQL